MLNGYKTYIGAAVMAIGTFLSYIPELAPLADSFVKFGEAIVAVGLGHKIAKVQ